MMVETMQDVRVVENCIAQCTVLEVTCENLDAGRTIEVGAKYERQGQFPPEEGAMCGDEVHKPIWAGGEGSEAVCECSME